MYAVIFKAKLKLADKAYYDTAKAMRDLAFTDYGCIEFSACMEDDIELAISYWPTLDHITKWKQNPRHRLAQKQGSERWYEWYRVQIVHIEREYNSVA